MGVSNGTCDLDGLHSGAPVHVTVGAAGAWLDGGGYYNETWSQSRFKTFGFANVRIDGVKQLQVDFWGLSEQAMSEIGDPKYGNGDAFPDFEILDSVVVPGLLTEIRV